MVVAIVVGVGASFLETDDEVAASKHGASAPDAIVASGGVRSGVGVGEANSGAGVNSGAKWAETSAGDTYFFRRGETFVVVDGSGASGDGGWGVFSGADVVAGNGVVAEETIWDVVNLLVPGAAVKSGGGGFAIDGQEGTASGDGVDLRIRVDFDHFDAWLVGDVAADLDVAEISVGDEFDAVKVAVPGVVGFFVRENVAVAVGAHVINGGKGFAADEVAGNDSGGG